MKLLYKTQVIVIHGGDTFDTYEDYLKFLTNYEIDFERMRTGTTTWKGAMRDDLGEGFEVIEPRMPNPMNAKYTEWKLWFEKHIPYLDEKVVLVGHSLGGTFLAKFLSENKFPKTILGLFLVAPAFDDEHVDESMGDFIINGPDLVKIHQQTPHVFLYHSEDDPIVPFIDLSKFQKYLTDAHVRVFKDLGHFRQEHFPELVQDIKSIL